MKLKTLAVALMCTTALTAQADDSEYKPWSAFLGAGYLGFDSDRNIDDAATVNYGLGYQFTEQFALELAAMNFGTETDNGAGLLANQDVDGFNYHLDALYLFPKSSGWTPFLVAGLGEAKYDYDNDDFTETMGNLGAGVKKNLSDSWQLRSDARLYKGFDDGDVDAGISVAVAYLFGGSGEKAPVVVDADNDGVQDSIDQCPATPAGVAVDATGCPLDTDGDGVYDYQDQCADTPAGDQVDELGCSIPPKSVEESAEIALAINFDTGSSVVKSEYFSEVEAVAVLMKRFPTTEVEIQGHTDSSGAAEFNKNLSQQRADAVRQVFINEYGIDASRITAVGYGEEQPVADNSTREGKATNRRVIAKRTK